MKDTAHDVETVGTHAPEIHAPDRLAHATPIH